MYVEILDIYKTRLYKIIVIANKIIERVVLKVIRNIKLKNFLIKRIFPVFTLINNLLPKSERTILIYCANDELSDNSEALYEYLMKEEYYKKYKIYCSLKNYKNYESPYPQKVKFIFPVSGIWHYMLSKYVFYSMGKVPIKPTKKQVVIYLTHGIPLKKSVDYKNGDFFTYMSVTSEFFRGEIAKSYECPKSKICICGEPKTDRMFKHGENQDKTKLIIWAPTFRQSDYLGYDDSQLSTFLPFINNDEWEDFNEILREKNVKIIAKLHPVQSLRGFSDAIYSNLEIYSDKAFKEKGMELYDLLGKSNALIADYSSVYLEYLLLDKPIGFALADYEEYKDTRGFVLGNQIDYMPGRKIYNCEDLYEYIDDVINNRDPYKREREEMRNLFHRYKDGHNTERILKISGIFI